MTRGGLIEYLVAGLIAAALLPWAASGQNLILRANPGQPVIITPGQPGSPGFVVPPLDPQTAAMMQQFGRDPNVRFAVEFDPSIAEPNTRVTYRVIITAMPEGVWMPDQLPTVKGLAVGPAVHGYNHIAVGGMLQVRTTFNYPIRATNTGVFTMPAIVGNANGKPVTIPECVLRVVPAGTPGLPKALTLRIEVPAGDWYVGQMVPVNLLQYEPPGNTVQMLHSPAITGDSVLFEAAIAGTRREMRTIGGQLLPVYTLPGYVVPTRDGRVAFTGQAVAYVLNARSPLAAGSPVDSVMLSTDPTEIVVKRLPKQGELSGFTGAIGVFKVAPPALSANPVRAGDPVVLTVTVKGQGNLTKLVPPKVPDAPGWQIMEPVADASDPALIQARQSALFTYTMIPTSDQLTQTPAIPFSYFDPASSAYVDATIPAVPIKVLPLASGSVAIQTNRPARPSVDDPDLAAEGRSLFFVQELQAPGTTSSSLAPLHQRAGFLLAQLIPAGVLGGLWSWHRRRRYLALHPDEVRRARARRRLRHHLRGLRKAVRRGDAQGFSEASVAGFREAAAPAHAANPEALVCADVLHVLPAEERDGATGDLVRQIFSAANISRFAAIKHEAGADETALLARHQQVIEILSQWRMRL